MHCGISLLEDGQKNKVPLHVLTKLRLKDKHLRGQTETEIKASCLPHQMGIFTFVRRPSWPDSRRFPGETRLSGWVQVVGRGQYPASKPGRGN